LRQVVVKDGNLALTRLTPMSDAGLAGAGWAEEVVREFKATLTYISRFGYNVDDGLDVLVVGGDVEKQFFNEKEIGATNFRCLSVTEALAAIGSKSFGLEKSNYADALHAAWVSKKNTLRLPIRVPSIHKIMAPRLAARAGGTLMLLAAAGLAYFSFTSYQEYRVVQEDIMQRQNQKMMLEREYAEESKIFDALPVKPQLIKSAIAIKKTLETNTIDLPKSLRTLKGALGSDIILSELFLEHQPAAGLGLTATTPDAVLPPLTLPDGTVDRGKLRIVFKFALPNNMQLEQKVTRAEQLQKDLQAAFPGYEVDIVSQFGKVDREGKFEAELGGPAAQSSSLQDMAEFRLEGPPL
jgi:hypothetical protein